MRDFDPQNLVLVLDSVNPIDVTAAVLLIRARNNVDSLTVHVTDYREERVTAPNIRIRQANGAIPLPLLVRDRDEAIHQLFWPHNWGVEAAFEVWRIWTGVSSDLPDKLQDGSVAELLKVLLAGLVDPRVPVRIADYGYEPSDMYDGLSRLRHDVLRRSGGTANLIRGGIQITSDPVLAALPPYKTFTHDGTRVWLSGRSRPDLEVEPDGTLVRGKEVLAFRLVGSAQLYVAAARGTIPHPPWYMRDREANSELNCLEAITPISVSAASRKDPQTALKPSGYHILDWSVPGAMNWLHRLTATLQDYEPNDILDEWRAIALAYPVAAEKAVRSQTKSRQLIQQAYEAAVQGRNTLGDGILTSVFGLIRQLRHDEACARGYLKDVPIWSYDHALSVADSLLSMLRTFERAAVLDLSMLAIPMSDRPSAEEIRRFLDSIAVLGASASRTGHPDYGLPLADGRFGNLARAMQRASARYVSVVIALLGGPLKATVWQLGLFTNGSFPIAVNTLLRERRSPYSLYCGGILE